MELKPTSPKSFRLFLRRKRAVPQAVDGFTLIEVMMALLLAMIGLMGAVAVQQTALSATSMASDGAVAMRLASGSLEQLNARTTTSPGAGDLMAPIATGAWSAISFLDTNGQISAAQTPAARWGRRIMVTNGGISLPYNISVEITYALDTGTPRVIRLDAERRKTW